MKSTHFSKINFLLVVLLMSGLVVFSGPSAALADSFSDSAFQNIWQQADGPVVSGQATRSWLWGTGPGWSGYESYSEAKAGGQRLVQYFDKSRMELNDPSADRKSPWFVSNGLLTVELVFGRMQLGDSLYEGRQPARIPVAGDGQNNAGPTYAGLAPLTQTVSPDRTGQAVRETVDGNGSLGSFGGGSPFGSQPPANTSYAHYEATTRHNVPGVLWNWMQNIPGSSWLFALGYPISEAYWSQFTVAGQPRLVLVQLFQRRVLTYTPANPAAWQVEMGNIGQHYFSWRYGNQAPASVSQTSLDGEEQAFIGLINEYRQANGLGTLSGQDKLQQTARWMSRDLGDKNYFSHTDSLGRDPFKRMSDFGYVGGWRGENLAAGRASAQAVLQQWKTSPPHNTLMLKAEFKRLGIARYQREASTYGWYWALEFGDQ